MTETYASAEALEAFLGDPGDASSVSSFQKALELDEREMFPDAAFSALRDWGFHNYYIPTHLGGRLRSLEEVLALARVLSRRDLSLAIGHGKTYLGLVPVWGSGSAEQQRHLAAIAATGAPVSLGLTERAHGSDLLATDMRAVRTPTGFSLTGEKWLINNGTRSQAIVVLARTEPGAGPRGLSLLVVEKARLAPGTYRHVQKIRTHGIRGADISGVTFEAAELPAEALVGAPGSGLETVMRVIQLTRLLCSGFSLGAGDTALRCTLDFARSRKLYNSTVLAISNVRSTLTDAFADLLLSDAVAVAGARLAHVAPEQLSVGSAVVKYFVPATVEAMIRDVAVVLGARYYIREDHWSGAFQKLSRDAAVVSLFDGSTAVNLNALGLQLRYLVESMASPIADEARTEALFRLATPLPALDPSKLTLSARGRDLVVQSLHGSLRSLQKLEETGAAGGNLVAALSRHASHLLKEVSAMGDRLTEVEDLEGIQFGRSAGLFSLAKRYCEIHAAAACLGLWLYNRERLPEYFQRGDWVHLCLNRVSPNVAGISTEQREGAVREMERMSAEKRLFSIAPFQLAGMPPS
ncbi:acyl-CoA dehydrogenase family protein [Stigmatella sp. ncwal1]|uniref:Acyl-CoA dehydrogenase family protein n=1 Tax=Stigmatella ashevillensis TaxID=2995309 RepID=A0ABT5D617_9BACT|nr:acyl-CoA dehydrogenase family protein [Stigmatella ashevillena]MDC0708545.1 acyl-CoA dehydrogenase family protein [Stigmatella ashevillena]